MTLRTLLVSILMLAVVSTAALASGGGGGGDDEQESWTLKSGDFRKGVAAVDEKDYKAALEWFGKAVAADPKDADAVNYLGYTHRKLGDYATAIKLYQQALTLNPKHLGAYEYLGEAYLELKDLERARQQLAKLDDLCWLGCKEYSDLKAAVRKYEKESKS